MAAPPGGTTTVTVRMPTVKNDPSEAERIIRDPNLSLMEKWRLVYRKGKDKDVQGKLLFTVRHMMTYT